MISVAAYLDGRLEDRPDPADISELVGHKGRLLWVDVYDATDDDLKQVQEEFSLHPLAIEDIREHDQRPKLELYPDHAFVVAYSKDLAEVDIFVGDQWVVTVRGGADDAPAFDLEVVQERFDRTCPKWASSGFLLYTILDVLVDGYFKAAEEAEEHLESLEDRIFGEQLPDERAVQEQLFDIRRSLLRFRKKVVPLREVLSTVLRGEVAWIEDEATVHLQDVYDHVLRAIDQLDGQRELMGNAVDAHLAIISNRMNQVMKKMTSWGALLLGSTLVAGIYGMNFDHMPELSWRLGYPMALGLMVVITVVGYLGFKRKDWL